MIEGKKVSVRPVFVWGILSLICCIVGCLLSSGCALLNPGGQVGESHKQRFEIGWTADEFKAVSNGLQEQGFTMAEGEIVMMNDAEGNPVMDVEKSVVTAYLRSTPVSRENTLAGQSYATAGVQQTEALTRLIEALVPLFRPTIRSPPKPIPDP